jgi:hypothetical protein
MAPTDTGRPRAGKAGPLRFRQQTRAPDGGQTPIFSRGPATVVVVRIRRDGNLAPAQDVDLPLAYPQFEHLVGQHRRIDNRGPRSDLKLAFWRAIDGQSAAVAQKSLGRFRAAHGKLPLW